MSEATAIYLPVMALQPDEDTGGLPRSALPDPRDAEVLLRRIASRIEQRLEMDPGQAAAISRAGELEAEADTAYLAGDIGIASDRLRAVQDSLVLSLALSSPDVRPRRDVVVTVSTAVVERRRLAFAFRRTGWTHVS